MNSGPPPPGVSITRKENFSGSLGDMASQVTTDTLLRYKGARLLKAQPFPPCPGEAGLQTFALTRSAEILEVAFTQWNGTAVTAAYRRARGLSPDARAEQALRGAVCSA